MKSQGSPTSLASHPHYERWQEFAGLVVDGVKISRSKLQGTGGAEAQPLRRGGQSGYGAATEDGGGAKKEKSAKKEKRVKQEKRSIPSKFA